MSLLNNSHELECNTDDFCPMCAIIEEIKARYPMLISDNPWPHVLKTEYGKQIKELTEELMTLEGIPGSGMIYFEYSSNFIVVKEYPHVEIAGEGWHYYEPKYQPIVNLLNVYDVPRVLEIIAVNDSVEVRLVEFYIKFHTFAETVEQVTLILNALEDIDASS